MATNEITIPGVNVKVPVNWLLLGAGALAVLLIFGNKQEETPEEKSSGLDLQALMLMELSQLRGLYNELAGGNPAVPTDPGITDPGKQFESIPNPNLPGDRNISLPVEPPPSAVSLPVKPPPSAVSLPGAPEGVYPIGAGNQYTPASASLGPKTLTRLYPGS